MTSPDPARRILLLGASGTIGMATAKALLERDYEVVCLIRRQSEEAAKSLQSSGAIVRLGEVSDIASLAQDGFAGQEFDAVISCLASRTGVAKDAWKIDYKANVDALALAKQAGVRQFILLSAICVQKPVLAFQHAKLAFEAELAASGLTYSIVRPTAYFKSLSGQIERVKAGKPFMVFGDGTLTACKPISDEDLANYIADCLTQSERHNRILPIGGPGEAMSPKQQAEFLFSLMDKPVRIQNVPPAMLKWIARVLSGLSRIIPPLAARAEYARIGHYYATESMLVWDAESMTYRADLTPSTGTVTLLEHYRDLVSAEPDKQRLEAQSSTI
ncbi:MAG: NAD(P)H-binding protein [Hyphomonadaceae bacterium]|nr:NAD(P)H-binding protein [Hyphomonadaceae bacterium]